MGLSEQELLEIPSVGEKIARSILDYFADKENRELVQGLQKAGLQMAAQSGVRRGGSFRLNLRCHGAAGRI